MQEESIVDWIRVGITQFILFKSYSVTFPIHCFNGLALWKEFPVDETVSTKH